ncbi:DNA-binding response regulator [Streptomyces ruber]|uniref:DNA-binding response regulator n=2 Tax=Streptomyces TaxID=1883 RepID=A0A918ETI9_9ACTN|nr:response regulator transcription factor [Streptomyces ruber]GGQ60299.1 DNA-binding response regulator [Streptomyces ruber]
MYGSVGEKTEQAWDAREGGRQVLIAVDDPGTLELLTTTVGLAGYRTEAAGSRDAVLDRLADGGCDLVILDSALPGLRPLEEGRRMDPADRPAVLLLVPTDSLSRIVPELGWEATDYVTKPLRIAEVLARMQVLLRGTGGTDGAPRGGVLECGGLALDDTTCRARRGRRVLDLTPAEYRLLRHLLVNVNKVLSKEQIARYVWGEYRGDNAIEQLVSRLRRKVDQGGPALIHTRRGFGYWLGAEVNHRSA